MDIIEIVNHYWPNTIARLGMKADKWPGDQPPTAFMGVFVEVFPGATLPAEAEVHAKVTDYLAYLSQRENLTATKRQIAALEAQQTPRRLREALAGTDSGWLANLDVQIATLRSTL